MDPTQVQRLKLNINNIKSVLTESTGDLKDAKKKKRAVIRAKIDEEKRLAAEKKLEKKSSPLASIGKTIGKAAGSVKDAFGKVIEFGALILFGNLVSKLPAFEEQWKDFTEKYKPMFDKLGKFLISIRDSITGVIDSFAAESNDFSQDIATFDENDKLISGKLKELDDTLINIQKMLDNSGISWIAKKLLGIGSQTSAKTYAEGQLALKEAMAEQGYTGEEIPAIRSSNMGEGSGISTFEPTSVNIEVQRSRDIKEWREQNPNATTNQYQEFLRNWKPKSNSNNEMSKAITESTNDDVASLKLNTNVTPSDTNFKNEISKPLITIDDLKDAKLTAVNNNSSKINTLNSKVTNGNRVTTVYVGTQVVEKIVPVA